RVARPRAPTVPSRAHRARLRRPAPPRRAASAGPRPASPCGHDVPSARRPAVGGPRSGGAGRGPGARPAPERTGYIAADPTGAAGGAHRGARRNEQGGCGTALPVPEDDREAARIDIREARSSLAVRARPGLRGAGAPGGCVVLVPPGEVFDAVVVGSG